MQTCVRLAHATPVSQVKLLKRHDSSNKGACTRHSPTHLFERREKRRTKKQNAKHRKESVINHMQCVNIQSQI